jgi:hypothetical protein
MATKLALAVYWWHVCNVLQKYGGVGYDVKHHTTVMT